MSRAFPPAIRAARFAVRRRARAGRSSRVARRSASCAARRGCSLESWSRCRTPAARLVVAADAIVQDCRMPSARNELVDHCIELLGTLGQCTSRRMFGGYGFYIDGLFVALIAYER